MATDVEIPKPISSGATDEPDAEQAATAPPLPEGYSRGAVVRQQAPPLPVGYMRGTLTPTATNAAPKPASGPTAMQTHDQAIADKVVQYGKGLANSIGVPESGSEYKAAAEDANKINLPNVARWVGGPAADLALQAYGSGKNYLKRLGEAGHEAYEAGQNIAEGGPVLQNLAKPTASLVEANVGAVPFVGEPTVQAGKDIAAGNKAHAAGELTGAIGQIVVPELHEHIFPGEPAKLHATEVKQMESNVANLAKDREVAQTKYDAALAEHNKHTASHAQGIGSPEKVVKEVTKTKDALDEAVAHHELAKEALAKKIAAGPPKAAPKSVTAAPEVPAEQIEAAPAPGKIGEKPKATTGNPEQFGARYTTTPKPIAEPPRPSYGRIQLPGGEPVGQQRLLTEGTPEGPQVPKGGLPKISLPEEKPAPVPTDEASLRALEAKKGQVVENPQKKVHELLKESLKTDTGTNKNFPAAKVEEAPAEKRAGTERRQAEVPVEVPVENERRVGPRRNAAGVRVDEHGNPILSPDVEGHWQSSVFGEKPVEDIGAKAREANPEPTRAETKPALPKEEPTGYEAKKEEIVPVGEEGRGETNSAAEYHPAVRQKVYELSNVDLDKLAEAHGLNPKAPEYSRSKEMRNEGRHQVGRQKLADDITAQMDDEEKINIGRAAEAAEKEPGFASQDQSGKAKAARARKLFPRLREEGPGGATETGYGSKNTGVTKEAKDAAVKSFNDKATRSNAGFDPTMLKDAAKVAAYHIEAGARAFADFSAKMVEDFGEGIRPYLKDLHTKASEEALGKETAKTSAKDTDHMQAAIKELGPDAKLSDITNRAQEMKDTHAQLAAHEANGGSTFSPKGKDLNGTDKYSVGAYPDRTEQVDKLTPEHLDEFKKKNTDVLSKEGHAVGTWKDPDTGKAVLDVTKLYDGKDEAIAAGKAANQKAIYHLGGEGEIQTGGTGEARENKDFPDKIERPKTKGKDLPTGDALIKKYGETKTNDPKGITFILDDGRKVGNTGVDHDQMLGGKATDKNPLRERFVQEGNIRVREHQGAGGRTVAFSIPESGVNAAQLAAIKAMGPQLSSGGVAFEVGQLGGKYETIPYGEATNERIEQAIQNITGKGENPPKFNAKGAPIDEFGNPTVSGGSPSAGAAPAKTPEFDALSEEHLTPEEKAGLSKSAVARRNYADNMAKLPPLQEWVDAAKGGEGARDWYMRSRQAFKALHEALPKYFQPEDGERWANFVASLSPRQMVHKNLAEAIHAWTQWVDDGRPMEDKAMEKSLRDAIAAAPNTKVPNAMKALQGKEMWPDLTKNRNFKVPSFGKNLSPADNVEVLKKYMNFTTNDGWQALFGGLDEKTVGNPTSYHPLSVMTRAAAKELGWTAEQAQAAIWSFTQALKERGEVDPNYVREYSEDFADILAENAGIRSQLKELGVDLGQLDDKLKAVGAKPEVTAGASSTTEHSTRQLAGRIEAARGKGAIPEPKQQRSLSFKEPPASEGRNRIKDEATRFEPSEFENEEPSLEKLGEKKKKSPYGNIR